jgi:hypothetical protein
MAQTSKKLVKPEIPRIKFNDGIDLYDFFVKNGKKIQKYIIDSITYGIQNKLKSVEVFEVQQMHDSNAIIVLCFDKSEWNKTLEHFINQYIEEDNYEYCTQLQNLKKKIK